MMVGYPFHGRRFPHPSGIMPCGGIACHALSMAVAAWLAMAVPRVGVPTRHMASTRYMARVMAAR